MKKSIFLLVTLFLCTSTIIEAQYFGKNKPRYRSFDFNIEQTPHFDIYYYMKNRKLVDKIGQHSEMWYDFHSDVFADSISFRNPIILYNNHADFQQTNTISGAVGVGTGGVTEAFKNRVIMPVTFTSHQTNHVLGHELVHAFQYNAIINGDSTSLQNLRNLPLWMVEGLAEYLSIGRKDPFTAMWMRDAVMQDDVPTLRKLNSPKYFPYRWGQAVWSFVTGLESDKVVNDWFMNTAMYGLEYGIDTTFNMSEENLSELWRANLVNFYTPQIEGKSRDANGKKLISKENSGRINVSPSLSPNGNEIIFLSEKDLFSTDLFYASTRDGKIKGKVASVTKDAGLDHLNLLESSGSWSPDGEQYVFVGFKKGKNVLVIKDVSSGKTVETISIKKVPAFENPEWSPDGKSIILSGLVEGQVDLYQYNLRNGRVTQLTDDEYSEIQSDFSADGSKLAFSYDRRSLVNTTEVERATLDIAVMDVNSGDIEVIKVFPGANNISPQFDEEGNLYFVSDRDGYRNLYYYNISENKVYQQTDLVTGISGITQYSPAISAAKTKDLIVFTYFINGSYEVYRASKKDLNFTEVDPLEVDQSPGYLPPASGLDKSIVEHNLDHQLNHDFVDASEFKKEKYSPKFKLDYIGGGAGIGVATSNIETASGLQGGIDMLFSDILGNNQLSSRLVMNGEIFDFGGQVAYLNRSNRLAYGVSLSHIPQRTGYQQYANDVLQDQNGNSVPVVRRDINLIRVFNEGLGGFVHYPFSTRLRLEGGLSGNFQSFRQDRYSDYYLVDAFGNGQIVLSQREKVDAGDEIRFNQYYTIQRGFGANANVALVGDNSYFGLTAPLAGHRFRISAERNFGINDYTGFLVDGRRYIRAKPFTFAFRGTSYLRFENDVNSVYPFYVGQIGFVRGYGSMFNRGFLDKLDVEFGQMLGSKIALASAEIRLPFTGPKLIALIKSNALFSDLNLFVDAGMAFDEFDHIQNGQTLSAPVRDNNGNIVYDSNGNITYQDQVLKPELAASAGISMRINLFGALILEPHYAWSLRKKGVHSFGLNLMPGW